MGAYEGSGSLRQNGNLPPSLRPLAAAHDQWIAARLDEGWATNDLARVTGFSARTIYRIAALMKGAGQ